MGPRFQPDLSRFTRSGLLIFGLALGCGSSGPPPKDEPSTTLPIGGGGGGGGGGQGDSGIDSGADAGFDAGGQACDGGCLQRGEECEPDELNGGCAPGLLCEIDASGFTYTCQGPGGDF